MSAHLPHFLLLLPPLVLLQNVGPACLMPCGDATGSCNGAIGDPVHKGAAVRTPGPNVVALSTFGQSAVPCDSALGPMTPSLGTVPRKRGGGGGLC